MYARLLASGILAAGLMQGAAFAQSSSSKSGTAPGSSKNTQMNQSNQSIPQEIAQKLKDQGFTNVQVVPGSILVSAKDQDGDPVRMFIDPNSMTVLTMMTPDNKSTTGSASSSTSSDNKSTSRTNK